MPKPKGKPLTRKQCQEMHDAYIRETQEFLKPWIQKGATWAQCSQAIEFGDDERDEDVVNPLFPDMDTTHVADSVNINDAREDEFLKGPDPFDPM